MAPTTPIAPASVGVASPMKMVPSTMKISASDGTMPRMHFQTSGQPRSVRASGGSAGTSCGRMMRQDEHPAGEQQHLDDAGAGGADVHVAGRPAELVGEHDQHQRGRDELGDGARRGDDAGGVAHVVAVARHHRQRDQPHGDDRGGDRAGDGAEDRADEDHRIGQAAAHAAEQLAEAFEQILGQAAAFEDHAHEGEERDRQQQLVGEHARTAGR